MPPFHDSFRRAVRRRQALVACTASLCAVCAVLAARPADARAGSRRPHEGDILRIFDDTRVYVVTNDDPALADALLQFCRPRERKVLTLDEWDRTPRDVRDCVSTVFLVNRELLPPGKTLPDDCPAARDSVYMSAVRSGHPTGITHSVTLSAPDSLSLRSAVTEFRRLSETPRRAIVTDVRSLAVIPATGSETTIAASYIARADMIPIPHLLPHSVWESAKTGERLAAADELILLDRSAASGNAEARNLCAAYPMGDGDVVVWRERKPDGHWRAVYAAQNADLLAEALRLRPDPTQLLETPEVVLTVRDLRSVRRIAVAGVRTGPGGAELSARLASRSATDLRTLDSFEVLERAGLSAVLGEIALGQAGITQANDRAKVRQMAAADALLVVEVTDATGGAEFKARHTRETPALKPAPRRPQEPSRAKYSIKVGASDDSATLQSAVDSFFGKVAGTKTDREYRTDLAQYNDETLPAWEKAVGAYNREKVRRTVKWTESVVARRTATISGSLRLVDLTDGLVLWEKPFSGTETEEQPTVSRVVYTQGEDSSPEATGGVEDERKPPADLLAKAAEAAVHAGILALRGTALLPPSSSGLIPPVAWASTVVATTVVGKILDIDGDSILIGLGATDGVRLGDTLTIDLGDGKVASLTVTRVRPRTCDAAFSADVSAALKARANVGMAVKSAVGK